MEKIKQVGQTKAAGFQIGVRKTFPLSLEATWNFLVSEAGLSIWLGEIDVEGLAMNQRYKTTAGIEGTVKVFKPNSHIRLTWQPEQWANASALQIRVIPYKAKTTISFHQDKLLDRSQRDEMKEYWQKVLTAIEKSCFNGEL